MLDPRASSQLMARLRDQPAKRDPLTGQERRILELIGEGLTNRQIGEHLFLAEKTVRRRARRRRPRALRSRDLGPWSGCFIRLILYFMYPIANQQPSAPENLTTGECLRLLASVRVGRIVYTRQALPAVELVNFTLDDGDIVIRTGEGCELTAAALGTVVAFEVDDVDTARQRAWTVTAVGYSLEVTDPDDIERLRRTGPRLWGPGGRDHFIRITPGILTGRRLG
jgi:hypothetical protein